MLSGLISVLYCQLHSWKRTLNSRLQATSPYPVRLQSQARIRNSIFLNGESTLVLQLFLGGNFIIFVLYHFGFPA